jgi:hypothetical protein
MPKSATGEATDQTTDELLTVGDLVISLNGELPIFWLEPFCFYYEL